MEIPRPEIKTTNFSQRTRSYKAYRFNIWDGTPPPKKKRTLCITQQSGYHPIRDPRIHEAESPSSAVLLTFSLQMLYFHVTVFLYKTVKIF